MITTQKHSTTTILGDDAEHVQLSAGYTVQVKFYALWLAIVEEALASLTKDRGYTLQMIVGDAYWGLLLAHERQLAGRCMAKLVKENVLPFRFINTKPKQIKRYALI
jgi:hypothetical protein